MAHTDRKPGDNRPHPVLYKNGSTVGMMTSKGLVTGLVTRHDPGGWIYVNWNSTSEGFTNHLPGYLRSTNVIQIETQPESKINTSRIYQPASLPGYLQSDVSEVTDAA